MRRPNNQPPAVSNGTPTPPLAQSPDRWSGFLLHRVAAIAKELYGTQMAQIGLRPSHVGILQLLATQGPMVQAHLAERLGVDKAAMVSHLNELENAHFVERRNHPEDRRAFLVHLRSDGLEQLAQIERVNQRCSEDLFKELDLEERASLHALLMRIYESHTGRQSNPWEGL